MGIFDRWRPLRAAVAKLLLAFRGWRFASLLVILSGFLGDAITRIHLGASLASLLLSLDLIGELLEQPLGTILALLQELDIRDHFIVVGREELGGTKCARGGR